jgi:hypothetical protein
MTVTLEEEYGDEDKENVPPGYSKQMQRKTLFSNGPKKQKKCSDSKVLASVEISSDRTQRSLNKSIDFIAEKSIRLNECLLPLTPPPVEAFENQIIKPAVINEASASVSEVVEEVTQISLSASPNYDVYDPLDFDLTADISDTDLISILEENMDYCNQIFHCNPMDDFAFRPQSIGNLEKTTSAVRLKEEMETIWIPLLPVLSEEDIKKFMEIHPELSLKGDEQVTMICPNCSEKIEGDNRDDFDYHMAETCCVINVSVLFE